MEWLISRLRERSTWLGIVALMAGAGLKIEPELADSIMSTGLALVGLISVLTKDKK